MKMSEKNLRYLSEGLNYLLMVKEAEINEIRNRTDSHYKAAFLVNQFREVPLTLEELKEQDVRKVEDEMSEIKDLKQSLISNENHLLVISKCIKLNLTTNE